MTTLRINWRKLGTELLPAIVQDARTGQVVMLGYMNREALRRTTRTGLVTFYSRSKKRLWMKGETSGNVLQFISASADCDGDALLIRAIPSGPTCHTGQRSCFNADESSLETLGLLMETIRERSQGNDAQSYTQQLLTDGVNAYGAKVLEEAEEVVRAAEREGKKRTIEEAADLLFHLLVLLRGEEIELSDIATELSKRAQRRRASRKRYR